jgi:hypothetical protein
MHIFYVRIFHLICLLQVAIARELTTYLCVSSLMMAMLEPDKMKYTLVKYVHFLVLRDCNHSQCTERIMGKRYQRRVQRKINKRNKGMTDGNNLDVACVFLL